MINLVRIGAMASGRGAYDYYVDSVAGSDSNAGTLAAPFQTLTKAASVSANNKRLGFTRGSSWREALSTSSYTSMTFGIVGAGAIPVISGADVVLSWTAEGSANVWQASVTHNATGSSRLTVYEDGVLLTRVANAATCSSTPGSFVDIKGSDGATLTVKIHATGSGDPNSNGKTYEVSRRVVGVLTGASATFTGPLITTKAISNNGSFEAGAASSISRILAKHGTKHNLLLTSGTATDCVTWKNDPPTSYEPSNTMFVSFMNDPSSSSYTWRRCFAIKPNGGGAGGTWGYAHGSPNDFSAGTIEQCGAVGSVFGGHPGATAMTETGCHWQCASMVSGRAYTINYSTGYLPYQFNGTSMPSSSLLHQINHSSYYFEERYNNSNFNEIFRMQGGAIARSFNQSALIFPKGGGTNLMANSGATGGTLSCTKSILWAGNQLWLDTDVSYTGNYNVFYAGGKYRDFQCHDGTGYKFTLADWQAATGQDANSCYLASADQVAGGAYAFFLGWSQAAGGTSLATIGPAVGDFRINPNARVYSGAGAAFIGTFPDGTTALTTAGAQSHWDWSARAVASGPPTAFPTLPQSEADCEAYIADPDAWDFYP